MAIQSIEELRIRLQWAIEVEHSTIPPYLTAYFSLKDANSQAAQIIRSVVIEEMLHLALACNMLNAIGGSPNFTSASFIPAYPTPDLIHHTMNPPLPVGLRRCSVEQIQNVFMRIEQPETAGAMPQDDNYTTLGQFYNAIAAGFNFLSPNIFTGNAAKQVISLYRASMGNALFAVTDRASALAAIQEIVEQGEGTSQTEYDQAKELAHYWKFNEIVDKQLPLDVYPVVDDPSTSQLSGSLRQLSQLFNDIYSLFLRALSQIFNTGDSSPLIGTTFWPLMIDALPTVAGLLMKQNIPGTPFTAGPSFEFSTTPQAQTLQNCQQLMGTYDLAGVYSVLQKLPVIDGDGTGLKQIATHGSKPLRGLNAHRIPPGAAPTSGSEIAAAQMATQAAQVPDTSLFGRMFPDLPGFVPLSQPLILLGMAGGPMDAGTDIPASSLNPHIPSGFTYFGQFLDHNITFDADSKLGTKDDPSTTTNFRSGRLDLSNVYGLGPETQSFQFYDQLQDGKFWIDMSAPWDVPRNKQGTALIADPRNDNTVITVQLHLAMMKFHNEVVDLLKPQYPPQNDMALELFERARSEVIWHYQWIVVHEWLALILKPDVYQDIMQHGRKFFQFDEVPFIPVEFSVAAYRLHPLVLERYRLNQDTEGILFHFRKQQFAPLDKSLAIDWPFMFDFGDGKVQHAKRFEAKIVNTFLTMPGPIDNPLQWGFDIPPENLPYLRSIAVRNLLRGASFGLPSGQAVAERIGAPVLTQDQLGLGDSGLDKAPLWYYVLKEAELQTNGATLGDVGSRIVGEVFLGLLQGDHTSYMNHPFWSPWLGPTPGTFTMVDLLKLAAKQG